MTVHRHRKTGRSPEQLEEQVNKRRFDDMQYDEITNVFDIVRERVRKSSESFVTRVSEVAAEVATELKRGS